MSSAEIKCEILQRQIEDLQTEKEKTKLLEKSCTLVDLNLINNSNIILVDTATSGLKSLGLNYVKLIETC